MKTKQVKKPRMNQKSRPNKEAPSFKNTLLKHRYFKPAIVAFVFGIIGCIYLISSYALTVDVNSKSTLLSQRVGFGRNVTGGETGPVVHVTNADDSGPGSLRAAVSGNNPVWVVFDGDYTITLKSAIPIGSNKTIDGRGRKVTINGLGQTGFVINNVSNIIIENIIMSTFGTGLHSSSNTHDAISINASNNIWLDHLDLSKASDKLIGSTGGTTDMTISWTHFHDQEQNVQLGAQATGDKDVNQRVTLHHNYFDAGGYRKPVMSFGKVHAYNNYISKWTAYGSRAERTGQLYIESNIYEAADNKAATKFLPADDGCNDKGTLCDSRPGYIKSIGNLTLNAARIEQNQPELVFTPSEFYPYTADLANDSLKNEIISKVGWQSFSRQIDCSKRPNRKACLKQQ
jgi:pectate lyase